ncbi:MAG: hypothetical protein H0Z24_03350 [Thermosipho sp. (in: Bacteria)]|nr:hypothetical protein [Thermosipho sp. (in: thermotogales)]
MVKLARRRGKIYIGTIENYHLADAHINLFCTTYSPNIPEDAIYADQLAPSFELFLKKKAWLDDKVFKLNYHIFKNEYLEEIKNRRDFRRGLDELEYNIAKGKRIVLFDNCKLGSYCHLFILKDVLKKEGYKVHVISNPSLNQHNSW